MHVAHLSKQKNELVSIVAFGIDLVLKIVLKKRIKPFVDYATGQFLPLVVICQI